MSELRQWVLWKVLDGRYGYEIVPRVNEIFRRPSRLVWVNGWDLFDSYVTVSARPDSQGEPGGPWPTQIFTMNNRIATVTVAS